jgi:hypothetical protein
MRPTWIVLGLVVGLGAVAYVQLRERKPSVPPAGAPLARTAGEPSAPPIVPEPATPTHTSTTASTSHNVSIA